MSTPLPTGAYPPPPAQGFGPPAQGFGPPADAYQAPAAGQAPYGYGGLPQQQGAQAGWQQPVQQQPYPQGYQQGWPATDEQGTLRCRFCGSVPAVQATFYGHQGLLIIMRFLSRSGPFCRDCGIATHRQMVANSLWQGWWGLLSALINPLTMLRNLPQRAKVNKLPPPMPGGPSVPMNPGRSLFLRPAILGLLVPVVAIGLFVYSSKHDPDYAKVGDCVQNKAGAVSAGVEDRHPDVQVISCSDPAAEARVVGKLDNTSSPKVDCEKFADADGYYVKEGSGGYTLCLHFLKP
ncbi:toxin-antitoxin system, toxin component [Streptomyces tateyamensis]|uniref:Toxin-antitoxin system, toxin component n=1 Tax=Streptomyces tateyamensis TaxID=565073 RepID=A0A2V4MZM5_9ACTN|nr:toxin-antitoxin system, toxin component [Streptomyces tateyamensis]PYC77026.1 toxin-antitoxin system, toxin component [Streptomyces tateyamensis]